MPTDCQLSLCGTYIYASVERVASRVTIRYHRKRNYRRTGARKRKKMKRANAVPRNRGPNIIWSTRETNLNTDVSSSFRAVSTLISRPSFCEDHCQLVRVQALLFLGIETYINSIMLFSEIYVIQKKTFYKMK